MKIIFFATLTSADGWEYFITKHTSTYQRPKNVIPHLKKFFRDIDIVLIKKKAFLLLQHLQLLIYRVIVISNLELNQFLSVK